MRYTHDAIVPLVEFRDASCPAALSIAPGSAIAATPDDAGRPGIATLDYEGFVHGQAGSDDDKAMIAAGRALDRYPTVARSRGTSIEALVVVGTVCISSRTVVRFSDPTDDLAAYLTRFADHGPTRAAVVDAITSVGVAIGAAGCDDPAEAIADAIAEGYEAGSNEDQSQIDAAIHAARQALGGGPWQPGLRPTTAELSAGVAPFA